MLLTPLQLDALRKDVPALHLIDVRLADDHAACRIPGSESNCVFEVAFLDRMTASCPDRSTPIVVFGAGADSLESRMAADKLLRAGYQSVYEMREGVAGWQNAGLPIETTGEPLPAPPPLPDGRIAIDLAESRVEWEGRNLLNRHSGRIKLKSGQMDFAEGQLTGGAFVIDMTAITCDDLAGNPLHDVLVHHLKSDDFFDVERFPESRFIVTAIEPISGSSAGAQNLRITGDLTMKEITAPVTFAAATGITADGKAAAQATIAVDRTRWNIFYGSGRFFRRLAGHLVNDTIELRLRIITA